MTAGRGFGQFYPVESPLHTLDPRAKLLAVAVLVLGLFLVDSLSGFLVVGVSVVALVAAARIPPLTFLRLLRPVLFIVALTAIFQILFSREGPQLFGWGILEIHTGGLELGFTLAMRILLLVSAANLLTATTAPVSLADGIEDILSPLKRAGFPAHEVAMMITIALRFIPTLYDESGKIMKAQAARGADYDDGGLIRRARAMIPVLVPLTIGAFRRADELAEAMESRGYQGGDGRTRYRELRYRGRDTVALTVVALILTAGILL
jgi:energy-coupling factor transport system permease protein